MGSCGGSCAPKTCPIALYPSIKSQAYAAAPVGPGEMANDIMGATTGGQCSRTKSLINGTAKPGWRASDAAKWPTKGGGCVEPSSSENAHKVFGQHLPARRTCEH